MNNLILRKKTVFVLIITIITMIAEICYGICTHSMALTADGFHMGCHAIAFLITLIVCHLAIVYRDKEQKLNALGGYTSALLLGITSFGIIFESIERLVNPINISFKEAILVAVIGLFVNILCASIMGGDNPFHSHGHHCCHDCDKNHHDLDAHDENLNFKAAYFHILADALTSILAIMALICGKYFGLNFLDSVIGVVGGIVIAKWSFDLIKSSLKILL